MVFSLLVAGGEEAALMDDTMTFRPRAGQISFKILRLT